ncbi:Hypothetical protein PHPALM_13955 [Phytophthora palmivora]|uniref:M96 mating-specific protein family n=1 Tax=Phytophthora palmivora TaxID=4796 RepID=A0A2P4XW00_9STRA|nr:Hypothetical protein PHPALM_13955 [Phytophthora palmivora]
MDLDPTLLFPEPVELLDQSPVTISSENSPKDPISSPSSDTQTSPDSTTIVIPVAAPPRRKRRKDELDYLRVKAKELENQLQQLKEREGKDDGVWRKVARRQLEGQKRAERENGKLRGMVEGQLIIVQNLEKLLRKRSALEESGAWANERKRVRVEYETENVIFDRILKQLDGQYKDTDAAFLQNGHAMNKVDGQHVQVKPDGYSGMFMEFLSSKIVPFELHATATQFWRCMAQPHLKLRDGHYSLVDGTEDTLSAKMAFTVQHKKHQVTKDAWFAVKRYIEGDSAKYAPSRHWMDLVERYPSNIASEDDMDSTIIQTCVRVRTDLPEVMPQSQEEVALLTDIVTSSFLENLDGIHQSVEDALVDEAMRNN